MGMRSKYCKVLCILQFTKNVLLLTLEKKHERVHQ